MTEVKLEPHELSLAARVGVDRVTRAYARGARPGHGLDPGADPWGIHVEGACAELAFAKLAGVYVPITSPHLERTDVAGCEIKSTRLGHGRLIVHENSLDVPHVLMIGSANRWRCAGWMMGVAAKQTRWWMEPATGRPAFFVPQDRLMHWNRLEPLLPFDAPEPEGVGAERFEQVQGRWSDG